MTIALTGATGSLGRLIIDHLLTRVEPHDIVAIVRDEAKAAPLADIGVQVRVAAYGDSAGLREALRGVESLLLISGNEVGRRVEQHRSVIEAAQASGVTRLIYTSAPHASTTALVLAPEHKATEEILAASPLAVTLLRNGWYSENYVQHVQQAAHTAAITAAAGQGRVASASRTDYAEAAAVVLTSSGHEGRTYELSGDHAWDYGELAEVASQILGSPVAYRSVDGATLVALLTAEGMDEGTAQFVAALDANTADGLLAHTPGDLARLIGHPTQPLAEGLRRAFESTAA